MGRTVSRLPLSLVKTDPWCCRTKEVVSLWTLWLSENSFQVSHPVSGESGARKVSPAFVVPLDAKVVEFGGGCPELGTGCIWSSFHVVWRLRGYQRVAAYCSRLSLCTVKGHKPQRLLSSPSCIQAKHTSEKMAEVCTHNKGSFPCYQSISAWTSHIKHLKMF